MNPHVQKLVARARAEGLAPPDGAEARLDRFVECVLERGARLALVSRADLSYFALAEKHLADALDGLLFAAPPVDARVADFGAGAGVVGVTWALLRPDLFVTLLESRHRKARFLQSIVTELGLERVSVIEGRGEEAAPAAAFDLAVSRGVATDRKTIAAYAGLLAAGGALLLFKGPERARGAIDLVAADGRFRPSETREVSLRDDKVRVFVKAVKRG